MEGRVQVAVIGEILRLLAEYTDRNIPPNQFLKDLYEKDEEYISQESGVCELFFHIVRMEPVLLIMVKEYCQERRRRHDDDILVLTVMIYLIVFQLTQRSRGQVKDVLLSLHPLKSYNLLKYLNNTDATVLLSRAASQVFDIDFVQEKVMKQFLAEGDVVQLLYGDIKEHFKEEKNKKRIPLTKPVGPSLLEANPRPLAKKDAVCETDAMNAALRDYNMWLNFSTELPETTYQEPAERETLRRISLKNRQESQGILKLANSSRFHCAVAEKSDHYIKTIAKIEEERTEQMKVKPKVKKPPDFKNVALPVKLNAATVLREGCRLQKEEEKSIKKVENMTRGGANSLYYEHMAMEMQRRQEEEHLAEIERKHLKGLLTHEEAALAKQAAIERNKEKSAQVKKEKEELERQMADWRAEEESKVKLSVLRCQMSHQGAREAQAQVYDRKAKAAQEMNEESRRLMELSLQEKQEELARKMELIEEIRALHMLHRLRVREEVDLNQTGGLNLLCEMSIVELRERLALLRIELQDELEERQHFIRQQREKQHELLSKTQEFIKTHRMARRCLNAKQDLKKVEVPKTQELEDLRKQLEEKREMRKQTVCLR